MQQARSRRRRQAFPAHPMRTSLRPLLPATYPRGRFANGQTVSIDPLNLLAVDAHANRSKGDGDTATYLPPYKPFRYTYVAKQIAVKGKYEADRPALRQPIRTRGMPSAAMWSGCVSGKADDRGFGSPPPRGPVRGAQMSNSCTLLLHFALKAHKGPLP